MTDALDRSPFWCSWRDFRLFVREGFSRWSIVPVSVLLVVATCVAVGWWDLVDLSQPFDPLLCGVWTTMAALMAWRFRPRRDLMLAAVAFVGGFLIEWWGTSTELWTYFTHERPPMWIIPAWPVAALSTERLAYVMHRAFPPGHRWLWWTGFAVSVPAFVVSMLGFMRPSWGMLASTVVLGIMVGVTISVRDARRDLTLFAMGTALGWLLERWGTTRECWTYYTGETPPLVTAFAHGFASVAFGRAARTGRDMIALLQRWFLEGAQRRAGWVRDA